MPSATTQVTGGNPPGAGAGVTHQRSEQEAVRDAGLGLQRLHELHDSAHVARVFDGEPVRDGHVPEPRRRRSGGQLRVISAAGAAEVVVAVEEGDVEASGEEARGEVEHAGDVAVHRAREHEHVCRHHVHLRSLAGRPKP